MFSSFVCLSVCLLATLRKNFQTDLHEILREGWQWASEQIVKFWWQSEYRLDTGIIFRIRHYWELRNVVSTDCAAGRCGARRALQRRHSNYDVITSSAHDRQPRQPVTVNDVATLVRRALAEVCTASVFLFYVVIGRNTGSPLVISVEDTEDSKPKDGRR